MSKAQDATFRQALFEPQRAIISANDSESQRSMTQLTLEFFAWDPNRLHTQTSVDIFQILLPRLIQTQPCVSAAAAALGAAYDLSILRREQGSDAAKALKLYVTALRKNREALEEENPEIMPLLVSATLLAAAESVQHKQQAAFTHVLGAFGMAHLRKLRSHARSAEGFSSLINLFNLLDQHISIFASGRIPCFPPSPLPDAIHDITTVDALLRAQQTLQQHCLHLTGNAAHSIPHRKLMHCVRHDLLCQQHHVISMSQSWLDVCDFIMTSPEAVNDASMYRHLAIAKAQMLACFIAISNVKPSSQTVYDAYAAQFEEIIQLAEFILHRSEPDYSKNSTFGASPGSNLTPFSPVPGIIHALSYTARKYRHPDARRRALALLGHAGIEGPLYAPHEALIASCIVALEEQGPASDGSTSSMDLSRNIPEEWPPEANRVCVAWVVLETHLCDPSEPLPRNLTCKPDKRVIKICRSRRGPWLLPDERGDLWIDTDVYVRMIDIDGICALEDLATGNWDGKYISGQDKDWDGEAVVETVVVDLDSWKIERASGSICRGSVSTDPYGLC